MMKLLSRPDAPLEVGPDSLQQLRPGEQVVAHPRQGTDSQPGGLPALLGHGSGGELLRMQIDTPTSVNAEHPVEGGYPEAHVARVGR